MIKVVYSLFLLVILVSCSSKPQKSYDVTTLQTISYALLDLADRKRQMEQYEQALMLYRETESYAFKRNDRVTAGLSQLKRAAIHIQLEQLQQAEQLIADVQKTVKFEAVPLDNAVKLIQARLAKAKGETELAGQLLAELEDLFKEDLEKRSYYRIVAWNYQPDKFELASIGKSVDELTGLKKQRKLNNIEIYSYAIYHYARFLAEQNNVLAETYLPIAIEHFSEIELSNKIQSCYELAAGYYARTAQLEKAEYHKTQAARLKSLLME